MQKLKGQGNDALWSIASLPESNSFIGYAGYNEFNELSGDKFDRMFVFDDNFKPVTGTLSSSASLRGAAISIDKNAFWMHPSGLVGFSQYYDPHIYEIDRNSSLSKRYSINYLHNALPEDYEELIEANINVFRAAELDFGLINATYKGYAGYAGKWIETDRFALFDSFDENYQYFLTLYDKKSRETLMIGRYIEERDLYDMILPPFYTSNYESNTLISMFSGDVLLQLLDEKSVFYTAVEQGTEENFLIKVKLKG